MKRNKVEKTGPMNAIGIIFAIFAMFASATASQAQAMRFDTTSYTTSGSCGAGEQCPVLAIPGTTIQVCTGLTAPCPMAATTYTDATAAAPCPSNAQLTPAAGGACLATSDKKGNMGFWILPGTYSYYLTVPAAQGGGTSGPYPISIRGDSGGYTYDANYATLALACAAAGDGTLAISKRWNGVPAQTLGCNLWFLGNGVIQPARGAVVKVLKAITAPITRIFDYSAGGMVSITDSSSPVFPQWWGGKGDGVVIAGFAIAARSAVLTVAAASFTANDAGKLVILQEAGRPVGSYKSNLQTSILSVTNSTTVVLADAASSTVLPGADDIVEYGTDNTSSFAGAVQATPAGGTIDIPDGSYLSHQILLNKPGITLAGHNFFQTKLIAAVESGSFIKMAGGTLAGGFHAGAGSLRNLYINYPGIATGALTLVEVISDDYLIRDNWIAGGYDGILMNGATNVDIENNFFESTSRRTIFGSNASLSRITGNTFYNTSGDRDAANQAAAVWLEGGISTPTEIFGGTITGNYFFYSQYGEFIHLTKMSTTSVAANYFLVSGARYGYPGQRGDISLIHTRDISITGNTSASPENKFDQNSFSMSSGLTRIAVSSNIATATVTSASIVHAGDRVAISGASTNSLNGYADVLAAPTPTTFTFGTFSVPNGTYDTGNNPGLVLSAIARATEYVVDVDADCRQTKIGANGFSRGWAGVIRDLAPAGETEYTASSQSGTSSLSQLAIIGLLSAGSLQVNGDAQIAGGLQVNGGYRSSDGSAGITGTACSSFKNGLCVAP